MRQIFILVALSVAAIFSAHAARIALVIGNSAYSARPLDNPVNDARAMGVKLQSLGFTVIKKENMRQREVGGVLRELRSKIKAGDEVLVFYAGHGLQVKGVNYLPVVDADIQSEDDVPLQSLSLDQILTVLDESKAGVKLLFLDACRDNPFARSFRSSAGGDLGRISSAPSGTLIHYATRPGSVAADGEKGGNGLYTKNLLLHIGQQGLAIEAMHKRVSAGVRSASLGKQEPWTEGQIDGEYYFGGAQVAIVTPTQTNIPIVRLQSAEEIEQQVWDATQQANTLAAFNAYLAEYSNGRFVSAARVRMAGLQPVAVANQPNPTKPLQALGNFEIANDGKTVRDSKTGLIWQRCSVGQIWGGTTCTGVARAFNFDNAQKISGNGWRMPTVRELASLIYCTSGQTKDLDDPKDDGALIANNCDGSYSSPTIQEKVFPGAVSSIYWSSSIYERIIGSGVWRVSFNRGSVGGSYRYVLAYVRLVRDSQ